VRWWKRFREDLDRPSFQAGIEKFGTGFAHDVDRVWQLLCLEEGPGIRELRLTDETLGILARQFRVTPEQAKERLDFMCSWQLAEIKTARDGEAQFISSAELKRRRDEWSKRKSRESKDKQKKQTPESLRSDYRETPEQKQMQMQRADAEKKNTTTAASRLEDLPAWLQKETRDAAKAECDSKGWTPDNFEAWLRKNWRKFAIDAVKYRYDEVSGNFSVDLRFERGMKLTEDEKKEHDELQQKRTMLSGLLEKLAAS